MKIVVLHGQNHKGSTWNITRMILEKLVSETDEVLEFQVDQINPCTGCFACIIKCEELCPHRKAVGPIIEAIENADIVIAESPNYCMGITGQLKILFDHMAYRWISHRPYPAMKNKIGLAISTTAGVGAGKVTKDIKQHMFWWGIPKIYTMAERVAAMCWNDVSPENKQKIERKVHIMADRILKKVGKVKPGIKLRFMFRFMGMQQKANNWNLTDKQYWKQNGWI